MRLADEWVGVSALRRTFVCPAVGSQASGSSTPTHQPIAVEEAGMGACKALASSRMLPKRFIQK